MKGFNVSMRIFDAVSGLNGFIGPLPSAEVIFVVFRGSENIQNWVTDMDLRKAPYSLCDGCEAHEGFLRTTGSVIQSVRDEAERLLHLFPTFKLIVTGHSLGAAIATLVAVDLQAYFCHALVLMYNFGSPRVFNLFAAVDVSYQLKNKFRFTHLNDMIPHFPFIMQNYEHISGEYYENINGIIQRCVGPDDKNCAQQWPIESLRLAAHIVYLNVTMHCPILFRGTEN